MHWCIGQNLDKRIEGPDGTTWFFLVGTDNEEGVYVQRIFFWDEAKAITGIAEWRGDDTLHFRRIKDRMWRIAKDAEYRERFLQPLDFPVQRHW
jgi:hypothetical protein